MGPDKSPGPDDFNPAFYQDFRDIIGQDVIEDCKHWLSSGEITSTAQATNIVLLPKVDKPDSKHDLRPISLCDVRYRILAKVLTNRLRVLMPGSIHEEQSAFVKGRSIIDNILLAFESIHSLTTNPSTKKGDVAIKIDISKAYDRVEWPYLEAVFQHLGFGNQWTSWMMFCVRSVQYQVLVNNTRFGHIQSYSTITWTSPGLPLSPFMFILCVEGLTALIHHATTNGLLHGYRVTIRDPRISHLLFADDSIFFHKATMAEATEMRRILNVYADATG
ncbi:LINE-1 reverse transcriptase homolog [Linum grandiflorum]